MITSLWNINVTLQKPKKYHAWSCQNVCDALTFLLDNIFIRFCTNLYKQVVWIPMGTSCAPLVANYFLLNLLNSLRKSLGQPRILSLFLNSFNRFNKTWVLMYHPLLIVALFLCRILYFAGPTNIYSRPIDDLDYANRKTGVTATNLIISGRQNIFIWVLSI